MLAGSHTLDEFQRWSNYLINATVLHLTYLQPDETKQLIERPIKDFPLLYAPEASNRVQELTRGHPHLVQLLCREIVNLKNEQPIHLRNRVTVEDVEAAVPVALTVGSEFFSNINLNQVDKEGRHVLRWLADHEPADGLSMRNLHSHFDTQTNIETTLRLLLRRELIEEIGGCYRFQTPLIKRWFASQKV